MKIIIAGAGAVGTHLAQLLAREDHDIVLMDGDLNRLGDVNIASSSDGDMMTLCAPPTTIGGLTEAGAADADLFVAVTPYETTNLTCCMLAQGLGAKKTVARVDNSEYMKAEYQSLFRKMGIHTLIYPEMLAASEIVQGVKRSWVRQYWEVHEGELILMGIKLRDTAKILGVPFKQMHTHIAKMDGEEAKGQRFHIVAIKRDDNTLIPNGDTILKLGDIAYFMLLRDDIEYIRRLVGKVHYTDVHRVIVMGGSRAAVHAINDLPSDMEVVVIERDLDRCRRLVELIHNPRCLIIHGDGTDAALLQSEDIERTHAFAALTAHAETNILACLAAKRMGVRKTVAMVENLEFAQLAERLDIGTIINRKTIAAGRIYRELLKAEVRDVKCLAIANADVAEFVVPEGAKVTQKEVKDLGIPQGITLGGLVRDGRGQLIVGNTRIQPGDTVVVFCRSNMMGKLDAYFK